MKKIILLLTIFISLVLEAKNIDSGVVKLSLKNNKANVINFPFLVVDAKMSSTTPKDFSILAKRNTLVVIPSASLPSETAEVVVWSEDGYSYLLKLDIKGNKEYWNLTSNRVKKETQETLPFEANNIDTSIKKLIKYAIDKGNIPGYRKIKVKRIFNTTDLKIQKDVIFNGAKYRVEKYYLRNKRGYPIKLDESSFYTKGIIAISFENRTLQPKGLTTMYLVVNKASLAKGD